MVNIKELVSSHLTSLDDYSRRKVARELLDKCKVQGEVIDRNFTSRLYNELDARAEELRKETKFSYVVSAKRKSVLVHDGEDFYRENVTQTGRTNRKYTLRESVELCRDDINKVHAAFIKEPTNAKRSRFFRLKNAMSSMLNEIVQSAAPEDITLAENYNKWIAEKRETVLAVAVV